jgi:hypothetical protein
MAQIYKWNWDMRRKSTKSSGTMSPDDSKDFSSSNCIDIDMHNLEIKGEADQ